jgi:hypothetical protein
MGEEFQWILKIGVWAREQMEDKKRGSAIRPTKIGKEMLGLFLKQEHKT